MSSDQIPRRPFGRHSETISALGLGGDHLGKIGTERDAIRIVHAAIDAGITFTPMTRSDMRDYRRRLAPLAGDGRFELYKTTAEHEGKVGREEHRFPSPDELGG